MIFVAQEDVLRGLKKCKRLAKQAILASSLTANPSFWTAQAESRRATYDRLMEEVERLGVQPTYEGALSEYRAIGAGGEAAETGKRQALEMFFRILGIESIEGEALVHIEDPNLPTAAQGSLS